MKEFSKAPAPQPAKGGITPFDIHQNAAGPVTVTDSGGPVLTNVEVVVIFWGTYWAGTSPPPAVSSDTYYQCFTGIVTGPYMTGMAQYRGVGPGTMLGKFMNTAGDPPIPTATTTCRRCSPHICRTIRHVLRRSPGITDFMRW